VAIAGAAVVAVLGAAMFLRKRQSHEELSDESEAVLRDELPQKTVEIPNGSSNEDSDTLLTSSTSFESKSKKSLKSVFRNNRDDGRLASPVFSISSSKSKSYNIEDTVDL
jgi:chromatin segregation and condensation protein Rec8/ScpA/Scc1 (kleisin family)